MACKHKNKLLYDGWCNVACRYCTITQENTCTHNYKTNGDKIRDMNDIELAKWISGGAMQSDAACSFCRHNKEKTCTGAECQNKSDVDIIMEWLRESAEG